MDLPPAEEVQLTRDSCGLEMEIEVAAHRVECESAFLLCLSHMAASKFWTPRLGPQRAPRMPDGFFRISLEDALGGTLRREQGLPARNYRPRPLGSTTYSLVDVLLPGIRGTGAALLPEILVMGSPNSDLARM